MILLENIWIWLAVASFIMIGGWIYLQNTNSFKGFAGTLVLGVAILALGFFLVYGIETDRQKVERTVLSIRNSIETNDINAVLKHVASDSLKTRMKAHFYMGIVKIEKIKIRDLKVLTINNYTSPPTATVEFLATVHGRAKAFDTQFTVPVHFDELGFLKEEDGNWYVTDQCTFRWKGGNSDGFKVTF